LKDLLKECLNQFLCEPMSAGYRQTFSLEIIALGYKIVGKNKKKADQQQKCPDSRCFYAKNNARYNFITPFGSTVFVIIFPGAFTCQQS
jgi:hypothetical protein